MTEFQSKGFWSEELMRWRANAIFEWNLGPGSQSKSPDYDQVPMAYL